MQARIPAPTCCPPSPIYTIIHLLRSAVHNVVNTHTDVSSVVGPRLQQLLAGPVPLLLEF